MEKSTCMHLACSRFTLKVYISLSHSYSICPSLGISFIVALYPISLLYLSPSSSPSLLLNTSLLFLYFFSPLSLTFSLYQGLVLSSTLRVTMADDIPRPSRDEFKTLLCLILKAFIKTTNISHRFTLTELFVQSKANFEEIGRL